MKKYDVLLVLVLLGLSQLYAGKAPKPRYRDAAYGGESVVLGNEYIQLVIYKRVNGWGWGELYAPDDNGKMIKYLGLMDYLAEVDIVGHLYPLRLDADTYKLVKTDEGQELHFDVKMQLPQEAWMAWDNVRAVTGKVVLGLKDDASWITYSLKAKPGFYLKYKSLRGPWLRIGAGSFGTDREDAIFPGLEWLIHDEWSSGNEYHPDSEALRVAPHPYKVSIPLMTVSYDGIAVGLAWDPKQGDISTLCRIRSPQPVFASPNFVERKSEHLMGLQYPSVTWGMKENDLKADPPLIMNRDGMELTAEIGITQGKSLDMVTAWVERHGLPDPGEPRFSYAELIQRIAEAYNRHLWVEGKGFYRSWHLSEEQKYIGVRWFKYYSTYQIVPRFLEYYIEKHPNSALSDSLQQKIIWCREQLPVYPQNTDKIAGRLSMLQYLSDKEVKELGQSILKNQEKNGSFRFDPYGRHKTWAVGDAMSWKPFAQPGDSVLDFSMTSALMLMCIGERLDKNIYFKAAQKSLDFAMQMDRPEGGDWWETQLHAPNLLTAGYAAMAYYVGSEVFEEAAYKDRAIHFMHSLLPFTTLWDPDEIDMLYNTKPLFGSSMWHAMSWHNRQILWQVLAFFDLSSQFGIDWNELDPIVDWDLYRKGIVTAGIRWMMDHTDSDWMKKAESMKEAGIDQLLKEGKLDTMLPDTYDPIANTYGGLIIRIAPNTLVHNIMYLLSNELE